MIGSFLLIAIAVGGLTFVLTRSFTLTAVIGSATLAVLSVIACTVIRIENTDEEEMVKHLRARNASLEIELQRIREENNSLQASLRVSQQVQMSDEVAAFMAANNAYVTHTRGPRFNDDEPDPPTIH